MIIATFVSHLIGERKLFFFKFERTIFSMSIRQFYMNTKHMIMNYDFHNIIMIMLITRVINYIFNYFLFVVTTMLIFTNSIFILNFVDTWINLYAFENVRWYVPKCCFALVVYRKLDTDFIYYYEFDVILLTFYRFTIFLIWSMILQHV